MFAAARIADDISGLILAGPLSFGPCHLLPRGQHPDVLESILASDFLHVVPSGIITKMSKTESSSRFPYVAGGGAFEDWLMHSRSAWMSASFVDQPRLIIVSKTLGRIYSGLYCEVRNRDIPVLTMGR
jgi:hypothetical protein